MNLNSERATSLRNATLLFAAASLSLIAAFFLPSFSDNYVLFFNDGPFGLLTSEPMQAGSRGRETLDGYWFNLNWLGQYGGHVISLTSWLINSIHPTVLGIAQWFFPKSAILLALGGWYCFRRLGAPHPIAILVAFSLVLSGTLFTVGAWGLSPRLLMHSYSLVALGLLLGSSGPRAWIHRVLAGFCLGLAVSENGDVGAIFSCVTAAAVLVHALASEGPFATRLAHGIGRITLVAACAAWIAWNAVGSLVATQITGISGTAQDAKTRQDRWDFATGWSFPKAETFRLLIPGVQGYRMDTPGAGAYWGALGPDGDPRKRFCGGAYYLGVLVLLTGAWAVHRAASNSPDQPFPRRDRHLIFFWAAAAVVGLLFAYGRHAPFYRIVYALPYFSTVRVPAKWVDVTTVAAAMLFGYGLTGIWRLHMTPETRRNGGWWNHLKSWWSKAPASQRSFFLGAGGCLVASVLGAFIYLSSEPQLERYIAGIGFPADVAKAMARNSNTQVWIYCLVLAASIALLASAVSGWFSGPRRHAGLALLAGFVLVDLARGNLPWVVYYDWKIRYQSNPVVDFLRQKPWEQRVTAFIDPRRSLSLGTGSEALPGYGSAWPSVHNLWLEHHFQYFNIHSLDIIQMPRMPELDESFLNSFRPTSSTNFWLTRRLWELTSTRYILGIRGIEPQLNQLFDAGRGRFRTVLPFNIVAKPGAPPNLGTTPAEQLDQLTAVAETNGPLAVLEFTGALPRARLFHRWLVLTNNSDALEQLRDPAFDPATTVILSSDPGVSPAPAATQAPSTSITHYAPKRIEIETRASEAGVLLLNDRWHPDWHISIDGQPASLLRANYLMRGVAVPAGNHRIEFAFASPPSGLLVTGSAVLVAVALVGVLARSRKPAPSSAEDPAGPGSTPNRQPGSNPPPPGPPEAARSRPSSRR